MRYDVIVIGGGHAGTEAAAAAARRGASVALLTFDPAQIGAMSCNPAIGGLGKGHIVREIDAFDGIMARAADAAAIHYRMLNRSKGTAVQGPRVQADRRRYTAAVQAYLQTYAKLDIVSGEASALMIDRERVTGVCLNGGIRIDARAVVLATGTFLGAKIFRGDERLEGGRIGERSAHRIAQQLRDLALPIRRLKTGTPPRIDGRTIDWARLERQESDAHGWTMSPLSRERALPQLFCAITRTNDRTHDVIRAVLDRSPFFSGAIEAAGPRYCPSIEDKMHRFGDRDGHQIFLEPEGLDTPLIYPNGISTSLPVDVQQAMVHSIAGLGRAEIVMPGYAVEYDHVDPRALDHGLGLDGVAGLYFAGQINGTTGYEEAAGQGLIAGINAAGHALGLASYVPCRETSYIGVMVDDLTLQGVTEPYRMLTARAEYRLRLRADNAETRLGEEARELGCLGEERLSRIDARQAAQADIRVALAKPSSSSALTAKGVLVAQDGARRSAAAWLRFASVQPSDVMDDVVAFDADLLAEAVQDARYAPYLERQEQEARLGVDEAALLPRDIVYRAIAGLSAEMVERLEAGRPPSLAAASRLRGITPAALTAILFHIRRLQRAA